MIGRKDRGYSKYLLQCLTDTNRDICFICMRKQRTAANSCPSITYCCDNCPRVFHIECIREKKLKPTDVVPWYCPHCRYNSVPQLDYHSFLKHSLNQYLISDEEKRNTELESFGDDGIGAVHKNYFNLFELSEGILPSIGLLALHFELLVDSICLDSISSIFSRYFHRWETSSNTLHFLSSNPTLTDRRYHEFVFLLRNCIGESIGIEIFDEQFIRLSRGEMPLVSLSLRPAISQFFQHCPNQSCREFRYFHRFCFKCGHLYNCIDAFKLANSLKQKYRHGYKRNHQKSSNNNNSTTSNATNIGDAINNNYIGPDIGNYTQEDDEYIFNDDSFEWSDIISDDLMSLLTNTPTEMAILRGLRYLQTVHGRRESQQTKSEEDSHVTFTLGGDFLFLLRNIRRGSSGIVQVYSEKIMIEWCLEWADFTTHLSHENIHDAVEGLYVLREVLAEKDSQLCDILDNKETSSNDSSFKELYQHIDCSMEMKRSQADAHTHTPASNPGSRRKRGQRDDVDSDSDSAKAKTRLTKSSTETFSQMGTTTTTSPSPSLLGQGNRNATEESSEHGRMLTRFSCQMSSKKCEVESLRQYLTRRYDSIRADALTVMVRQGFDILSFEPHSLRLNPPLTGIDYCGHCSEDKDNRKGRQVPTFLAAEEALKPPAARRETPSDIQSKILVKCIQCDQMIVQNINYSSYNDLLLWLYLFQELDLDCSSFLAGTLTDNIMSLLRILPLMRSYQSLDTVGQNTFIHQCYFVTHLIYFFSDYGSHPLTRELFAEEFIFILESIPIAVQQLDDPELVGEFLHCLNILQYYDVVDTALVGIVRAATQYLLGKERSKGTRGVWYAGHNSTYTQYHASFCAIMGLMKLHFTSDESRRTSPPVPKILRILIKN